MKKFISLLLILSLTALLFSGCATGDETASLVAQDQSEESSSLSQDASSQEDSQSDTPDAIRIGGLKGPTSMGMVKLMQDAEDGKTANNYQFTISGSADEVTPKLIQGQLDMAAVPANLASVLYHNTEGQVRLLAINTLGVVYICEKGDAVQSLSDLKGKVVYATGKGSTPEYSLRYILSQNGIDPDKDLTLEWKSEPTEVVALLQEADEGAVAMLPQPFVTVAQTSVEGLRVAIDLNKAWEDLDNGSQFLTGVLVVREDFAAQYPAAIESFLEEYQASTQYINTHIEEGAQLVEKYGIVKAAVAEKAIPYCNITFSAGEEMREAMEGYLQVLYDQNPASVGGALPGEDFYDTTP
jgi:NitT/TauT family transport system substrate-binding protein